MITSFVLLAALAGCAQKVRVEDRDTVGGGGRIAWQVVQPRGDAIGWSGVTVEGELSYREGESDAVIPAGRTVEDRGNTIGGGVDTPYTARAEVVEGTALVRTGVHVKNVVRLEVMAGGQALGTDVTIVGGGVQTSSNETAAGGVVGARLGIQPHELIEFYGTTLVGSPSGARGLITSERWDAGLRIMPVDHFGLYAVYRQTRYERTGRPGSDIKIDLSGPVFGVELRF